MEPQTPIPVFLPFGGGSSGTAAFLPAVWQEAEAQPEREFFDRLPEEEQQRIKAPKKQRPGTTAPGHFCA